MNHKHTRELDYNIDTLALFIQLNILINLWRAPAQGVQPIKGSLMALLLIAIFTEIVRLGPVPDHCQQYKLEMPCKKQ